MEPTPSGMVWNSRLPRGVQLDKLLPQSDCRNWRPDGITLGLTLDLAAVSKRSRSRKELRHGYEIG